MPRGAPRRWGCAAARSAQRRLAKAPSHTCTSPAEQWSAVTGIGTVWPSVIHAASTGQAVAILGRMRRAAGTRSQALLLVAGKALIRRDVSTRDLLQAYLLVVSLFFLVGFFVSTDHRDLAVTGLVLHKM